MASGGLAARRIVQWHLDRIAAIDDAGPSLNAVVEVNPDALAIADSLDAERAAGRVRGPLHGIPVLVKDNIDSADRMHTTAGSLALADHVADRDAAIVARLREAGAVLLGKTNLSEWANFRADQSTSGWSSRGGRTLLPYALDRNPCGSSSGTGVAIAAGLAVLGVGTETDGSIVCPSSANGLVGVKPTVGLVSRTGIIPISATQDTAGPMTRTVTDATLLLAAMRGVDPSDDATVAASAHIDADLVGALREDGLRGARIGVARKFLGRNPDLDAVFEQAIATLEAQGAEIVDPADLPTHGKFGELELTILLHEFKAGVEAYLAAAGDDVQFRTLADIIAFNEREKARAMPWFGQDLLVRAEATTGLDAPEYLKAKADARRLAGAEGIDAVMDTNRLDALVAPAGGPAWMTDLVLGDHHYAGSSSPAAVAGYPNVTVPMGHVRGLPVGLSFFGRAWSEPVLLRLAYAYEQATHARQPPDFRATVSPP
jgi:amidase